MNTQLTEVLGGLRLAVGYLGEKNQNGWWSSHFFENASKAFLAPIFHRTLLLTQYHGVIQAASRIHDEHIGVGQVYHLFRLPEDLEYGVHTALHREQVVTSLGQLTLDNAEAMTFLLEMSGGNPGLCEEGPVRVGTMQSIRSQSAWSAVAGRYLQAFQQGIRTYPYFVDAQ